MANDNASVSTRTYNLQDVVQALRAADAAGNTDDARRLAEIAVRLQTQVAPNHQPEATTEPITAGSQTAPDTSFSSALKQSFVQPLQGIGQSIEQVGKVAGSPDAQSIGKSIQDALPSPTNYQSATERLAHPEAGDKTIAGFGYEYLPRAAVEQVGGLAGSLTARGIGAAALAPLVPEASAAGAIAGPAAFGTLATLGPTVLARAQKNGHDIPTWDDWAVAAGSAGLQGLLESIGVKGLGKLNSSVAGSMIRQLATNTSQTLVQQISETAGTKDGLSVDPKLALAQGLASGVTGGVVQAGAEVARGINPPPVVKDAQATASLAKRLQSIANENGLDLRDTGASGEGANAAVGKAHTQIVEGIKALSAVLRPELADDPAIRAAIADAKRKGGFVSKTELSAIRDRVGDTEEGQGLLRLLREKNALSSVAPLAGKTGGISTVIEKLQPSALKRPVSVAGALAAGAALPHYAVPAALGLGASYGLARGLDALTGRRYPLNRLVQSYANYESPEGVSAPQAPSILATRKNLNTQSNAAPTSATIRRLIDRQRASELIRSVQLADVVPEGGWGRRLYDNLGLTPREVEKGLNILSNEKGLLTRGEVARAVDDPNSLMASKLGLAIEDHLNNLASTGRLVRAKGWIPKTGSQGVGIVAGMPDGTVDPTVARPFAYKGAIKLHNDAILQTDAHIESSGRSTEVLQAARDGLYRLGASKTKTHARMAIADAVKAVSKPEDKAFVISTLSPLVNLKTHE